jgi:orotidine-5'-phosphate decarboxylase
LEAERLRRELGDRLLIVTPGIRPGANVESVEDDQQRVVSAGEAIKNGASHVVVGRPISRAVDPLAVIARLQEEILAVEE